MVLRFLMSEVPLYCSIGMCYGGHSTKDSTTTTTPAPVLSGGVHPTPLWWATLLAALLLALATAR